MTIKITEINQDGAAAGLNVGRVHLLISGNGALKIQWVQLATAAVASKVVKTLKAAKLTDRAIIEWFDHVDTDHPFKNIPNRAHRCRDCGEIAIQLGGPEDAAYCADHPDEIIDTIALV